MGERREGWRRIRSPSVCVIGRDGRWTEPARGADGSGWEGELQDMSLGLLLRWMKLSGSAVVLR